MASSQVVKYSTLFRLEECLFYDLCRWLRAKEQAKKEEKEAVKNSAKLSRLKSRQAHKSQQLAKAMSFAQGYSFTDYYGYRFWGLQIYPAGF